MKSTPFYRMYT